MAYGQIPEPGVPIYLGEFFLEERRFPAVYFLYHRGEVVYVGQSKTLKLRIDQHLEQGVKKFDAVGLIRCGIDQLTKIESHWIRHFAPEYNNCGISKKVRQRGSWVQEKNRDAARQPDAFEYHIEAAATASVPGPDGDAYIRPKDIGKFLMISDKDAAEMFGFITESLPFMQLIYFAAANRDLYKAQQRFEELL